MLTRVLFAVLFVVGAVVLLRRLRGAGTGDGQRYGSAPRRSTMSRNEALQILGLPGDADQQAVCLAHRRLLQKLHPDHGGSDYLAQRINEARDRLSEP